MSECRRVLPYLDAFVDGELPPDKMLELEQHVSTCKICSERVLLQQAVQTSTRQEVRQAVAPSEAFRERVRAALAAEGAREADQVEPSRGRILSWRTIVPLAAAAALALVWGASVDRSPAMNADRQQASTTSATVMAEQLIDELVNHHANPPTPEVVEESLVQRFEPQVGVPVRAPSLGQYGAHWEGGSVVIVTPQHRRAASLRYNLDGHRVTVYVYDAARFPVRATLQERVVRDVPVYVGTRRGYSIAAAERRGVGYAVASDLDDAESAELAAASFR